jgi:predicted DNA-binding transcriptional regulator AlpA
MKKTINIQGKIFDAGQVLMERYGISIKSIDRWTKKGQLPPPIRLGKLRYFNRAEVEAKLLQVG